MLGGFIGFRLEYGVFLNPLWVRSIPMYTVYDVETEGSFSTWENLYMVLRGIPMQGIHSLK